MWTGWLVSPKYVSQKNLEEVSTINVNKLTSNLRPNLMGSPGTKGQVGVSLVVEVMEREDSGSISTPR